MMHLIINSDGGARGNPGLAGVGIVIKNNQEKPVEIAECIGEATNNQAEYTAVLKALEWVTKNIKGEVKIDFFLDSELVVRQLNQEYKIKNDGLKPLFFRVRSLILEIGGQVTFSHVRREQNKEADKLVNLAIDHHLKGKE